MSFGSNREKTFDPSSGGMGRRLKIASKRFICTTVKKNRYKKSNKTLVGERVAMRRTIILAITARMILVIGPAIATSAMSFLPSFRLKGSIGTGFAAPKITGDPDRISIRGSKILIRGSMWFLGLRVSLPASLAVGSPKRSATYP